MHIYNWEGEPLSALDFEQLHLQKEHWAWMTSSGVRDDLLHLSVGDWPIAKFSFVYKVK